METKLCSDCERILPLACFSRNKTRKDGLQHCCKACKKIRRHQFYLNNQQKYLKKTRAARKAITAWWREFKAAFACARCGENHPACIQFHHHSGNKRGDVGHLLENHSKRLILEEIKKCTPLCANCHAKEHWNITHAVARAGV